MGSHGFVTLLLVSAVSVGTPLLYTALGELVSETTGVINIELEGMMLCGAFFGILAAYWTHGVVGGFVCAALGGVLLAALHGLICFVFRANQVVSGVVLNIFALGITSLLLSAVLAERVSKSITHLAEIKIPLFASIPAIGPAFFDQDVMVYVALLACGCLAGVGGGQLAIAGIGFFTENMTAGIGYIALAAVIFGRWRAFGVLGAVLLFAIADAFQIRAAGLGVHIPYQFLAMLPYLVTLVALAGLLRRANPPSALAINYHPND